MPEKLALKRFTYPTKAFKRTKVQFKTRVSEIGNLRSILDFRHKCPI